MLGISHIVCEVFLKEREREGGGREEEEDGDLRRLMASGKFLVVSFPKTST